MYQQRLLYLKSKIQSVESRIKNLEHSSNNNERDESSVIRVKNDLISRQIFSFRFVRVSADYYDRSLQERALMLNCHTSQLCKSIVFENTACDHDRIDDCTNSRYYCVIVQYEARFDAELLRDLIHSLRKGVPSSSTEQQQHQHQQSSLPKKRFNFRLAPEEVSGRITGFLHNAVSPFGMLCPVPVVVCQRVVEVAPPYVYLGGGEVDLKLGIATDDLIRVGYDNNPAIIVGLISHLRQQQSRATSSSADSLYDDD